MCRLFSCLNSAQARVPQHAIGIDMNHHFVAKVVLTAALAMSFTGCASLKQWSEKMEAEAAASRQNDFDHAEDKLLLSQMYSVTDGGRTYGVVSELREAGYYKAALDKNLIVLQRQVNSVPNLAQARDELPDHASYLTDDLPAKRFIAAAKSRGDKVKLYKPSMGYLINSNIKHAFNTLPDKTTYERFDLSNAIIEFDRDGSIRAFMTKSYQATTTIGSNTHEYVNFYFGKANGRQLENRISNGQFAEAYVRDL